MPYLNSITSGFGSYVPRDGKLELI